MHLSDLPCYAVGESARHRRMHHLVISSLTTSTTSGAGVASEQVAGRVPKVPYLGTVSSSTTATATTTATTTSTTAPRIIVLMSRCQ